MKSNCVCDTQICEEAKFNESEFSTKSDFDKTQERSEKARKFAFAYLFIITWASCGARV